MTIKINKLAEIVGSQVVCPASIADDVAAVLTNMQPSQNPAPEAAWQMELLIGEGSNARKIAIDLPPLLSNSDPLDSPVFLGEDQVGRALVYFRSRLFLSERSAKSKFEQDELVLRVKKAVYDEDAELSSLRAAVANLEAAIEYRKSGPKREPIPEDVRLLVWARDGGACVRCGEKQGLQFDHIIPVALGRANTEENIQILCQICNRKRSDKIAFT
jgi:HNH endonuclease